MVKSVVYITNTIVRQLNREEMHIAAILLKSKETNDIFSISLEWPNNVVFDNFGKLANLGNAFRMARQTFNRVFRVQRNDLFETLNNSRVVICKRIFEVSINLP